VKVYQAIGAVSAALSHNGISKARKNTTQGYNFRGIDDVLNALSTALVEAGLVILPRCTDRVVVERETAKGGALFNVTCRVEFDLVSTEDGSKHTVCTYGEAMDSADKATNKAMSAAYKYLALLVFCIPTEATPDTDADFTTPEVAARQHPTGVSGKAFPPEPAVDMSPPAIAKRITAGVAKGDAAGAAQYLATTQDVPLDDVWGLLDAITQDKLTAKWPKAEAA
jgi:hypothetical protein